MDNRINFNIISKRDVNTIYNEFKKEFLNPSCSVRELKQNFDLSKKEYDTLRLRVLKETGLTRKPSHRNNNIIINDSTYLNHNKNNGKYSIVKSFNGQLQYFGQYDTKEEALMVRDNLIKQEWRK